MKTLRSITKLASAAIVISLLFILASCQLGGLELKSFAVDRSTVKTTYYVGEELELSGMKAYVKYSDSTLDTVYSFADLTVTYDDDITATAGTKNITVSFMDPHLEVKQTTTLQITVNEDPNAPKHHSYVVDYSGMKTEYLVGEAIDFSGIKLIEKFTNGGADVEITDLTGISYSDTSAITSTVGNKNIAVTYNGESAGTIAITVGVPSIKDITLNLDGVKLNYKTGDTVNFEGISATVTYKNDETSTIEYSDLTFSSVDTSKAGTYSVIVSFTDPKNNEETSTSFNITVVYKATVLQFEKSEELISFDSSNKNAGTLNYGDTGFSGQFLNGNMLYVIGDDNAFKMIPDFTVIDENGNEKFLYSFYSNVEISIYQGEDEIKLNKRAVGNTSYVYYNGENDIVTVDVYNGVYQFHTELDKVIISVLPSDEYYDVNDDVKPVILTAKVIDAYNVYSAKELAVINNSGEYKSDWDNFRTENGLPDFDTINSIKGIVLHGDIHVSKSDVPSYMFNVTASDIVYKNGTEEKVVPAGTYYLRDGVTVYERVGAGDFAIEGNFFTIDIKGFPLVASPAVFDASLDLDYGDDFSNAQLFRFCMTTHMDWTDKPADVPVITIQNTAFIGNAARNNWTDINGHLVSAGGLILFKVSTHAELTLNNTIKNSFFTSYLPDWDGHIVINDSKCFDSYQTAVFVWSNATCYVNNSYISGAGGPVVIAQSKPEGGVYHHPVVEFNDSVVESSLTGEELWFQVVNATQVIAQIKALGAGLEQYGLGNFSNSDDKMNIMGVLMPAGSSPQEVMGDATIQGELLFDGKGAVRWYDPTLEGFDADWLAILQNPFFQGGAFAISVEDADGERHFLFVVPSADMSSMDLYDTSGNQLNPYDQETYIPIVMPFMTADTITLHAGGLSMIFEFYHK